MTLQRPRRTQLSLALTVLLFCIYSCLISFGNAAFSPAKSSFAFVPSSPSASDGVRRSRANAKQHVPPFSSSNNNRLTGPWELSLSKDSSWDDEHLIHGAKEIHEETDEELKESEDAAAWDAHDASSDPGMEAASEERAVMLANEMAHKLKERAQHPEENAEKNEWNEEHLAHGASEIHEETDEELEESEDAAVWDAFDSASDPGMEAAMMERSVMMANEMAHKLKEKAKHANDDDEEQKETAE
jgi:hypothetical protein